MSLAVKIEKTGARLSVGRQRELPFLASSPSQQDNQPHGPVHRQLDGPRSEMSSATDSPGAAAQRYIEAFAGCGGLSLGLHRAGWEGIFAVEKDPMAFETLEYNMLGVDSPYSAFKQWPDWVPKRSQPIEDLLTNQVVRSHLAELAGQVTLVAGGPPCQGFSVGGIRNGGDHRNDLVLRMLELVAIVKPKLVVIENVEGIARKFVSKPGQWKCSVADLVVQELREAGYDADYSILDASRFGVPQIRRRVVILGVEQALSNSGKSASEFWDILESVRSPMLKRLGLPTDRPITAGEAIADLGGKKRVSCPDSPKFTAGTYLQPQSEYARLMRGELSRSLPNSHRFSKHGEDILELYRLAQSTQQPGRLPKSFLLSCGTKKDKKVLLDPASPASTITTHPDEFIHCSEPRNVTVREMARLQSFPDDFEFRGRYTINGPRRRFDVARCSQVGNAVPPLLGQAIGLALLRLLDS